MHNWLNSNIEFIESVGDILEELIALFIPVDILDLDYTL